MSSSSSWNGTNIGHDGATTLDLKCNCSTDTSGWKPTHITYVFALRTSVSPPDGTTLKAFADVNTDVNTDVSVC